MRAFGCGWSRCRRGMGVGALFGGGWQRQRGQAHNTHAVIGRCATNIGVIANGTQPGATKEFDKEEGQGGIGIPIGDVSKGGEPESDNDGDDEEEEPRAIEEWCWRCGERVQGDCGGARSP